MDWGNDYFTFSDTNIEYIWKFLSIVHEKGWLFKGHRATEWCPRCGTSISAHELHGSYVDRVDPSLFVRFRLLDRPGEAVVVWTTTPWTLPANVAAAVNPASEYGRLENGDWVAVARFPDETFVERLAGAELVGWRYEGPFDALGPGGEVEHRVIPWDDVSMEDGTGVVHIAPGCGAEDFELSKTLGLDVIAPVDEAGHFYPAFGWLHGLSTGDAAEQIIGDLEDRGLLVEAKQHEHRYPECWRCHTPLIFRLSDDWFIGVDEVRQPLLDANATVEWTPEYMGKRMDDWLRNMGDWNISRRRYYGLPLPFYPCSCGHLNVIGSRAELEERAVSGLDQLEELRRPWIDAVPIRCDACGEAVTRIEEVGDVWLDAGIVPFSTLGWENPEFVSEGYGTGAAKGLTTADLPTHATWEEWFPADWVSEMREQIRLWFYSQLFMSVALTGRAPFRKVLGYEKMLDEHGKEMHGSWGNMISATDAFSRMGADVMRWQYCSQPPDRNLLFGFGPAQEIKRRLLTLWNSAKFLGDYGAIESFQPVYADLERGGPDTDLQPLDHWLVERTAQLVAEAERRVRALADGRRDARLRGVRRRSLELVHPAFPAALLGRRGGCAPHALVRARPGASRDRARDAVPRRAPLAGARHRRDRGRAGLGLPRRLAGGARAGRRSARRGERAPTCRRAGSPGTVGLGAQAAPAASADRRRGRAARGCARRRDRGGAPREGGRVRPRRRGAAREAASAGARAEAREGAGRRSRCSSGGRLRGARRRTISCRGARAGIRTRCSSSARGRMDGRSRVTPASPSRSTRPSTTSWRSRDACTSSSTASTRCGRMPGSS